MKGSNQAKATTGLSNSIANEKQVVQQSGVNHSSNDQNQHDQTTINSGQGPANKSTRQSNDNSSGTKSQLPEKCATAAQEQQQDNQSQYEQQRQSQQSYDIAMDQFQVIDSKRKQKQSQPDSMRFGSGDALVDQAQTVKREYVTVLDTDNQIFLTGVNVQHQDIESYRAIMEKEESPAVTQQDATQEQQQCFLEDINAPHIDKYKLVAVVDSGRSLSNNECVYVNSQKNEICHLSVNSHTSLKFDELVSSYEQVFKIGKALAHNFVTKRNTNKVCLNVADQFATNNNCGFNLANFRLKFLKNFFDEVVSDYERSFIGSFANALLKNLEICKDQYELYFTIAKFEGNMGYSLTQNQDEVKIDVDLTNGDSYSRNQDYQENREQHQTMMGPDQDEPNFGGENATLQAKGLQDDYEETSVAEQKVARAQQHKIEDRRRHEILKKGSIPEFVQITSSMDFYRIYQEACHRNKLLVESQQNDMITGMINGEPDAKKKYDQTSQHENIDLRNIKDDVVIMQFKLVRKDTMKVSNTQTFVNLPSSKLNDINIVTLMEIIQKQNSTLGARNQQNVYGKKYQQKKEQQQFMPYNKSILTRILHPYLSKANIMVINHFSKNTILRHLKQTGNQVGPAKGLFNPLFRLGFDTIKRLKKQKLQQSAALDILERQFSEDLDGIYKEIGNFREGMQNFEVYTRQTANQLLTMQGIPQKNSSMTMFHQMMHFLVLQEEMTLDAENFSSGIQNSQQSMGAATPLRTSNFFPSLLPEEEIQKVIFDSNYLEYIQKKHFDSIQEKEGQNHFMMTSQGGYAYQRPVISQNPEHRQSNGQQSEIANTSVQMAAQIAKESMMPHTRTNLAVQGRKKQIQFVQYENIKSELKEEYDKRVGFLNKRLSKKAQMDPSFLLLNDMAALPLTTNNSRSGGQSTFFQGLDPNEQPRGVSKAIGQQIQLQKKILAGPKNRLSKSKMTQGGNSLMAQDRRRYGKEYTDFDEKKQTAPQKQAEYYKFYLENAQKAINLMIDKHKSQGGLSQQRVNRTSNGAREHHQNNFATSAEHIIVNGQESGHDEELQEQQASTIENTKGEGYMKSAAGVGIGHAYGIQKGKANVNRSYSLHERRFNPAAEILRTQVRLEPLVQRHQKISRITVRNQQEEGAGYGSKNLKQIDEDFKGKQIYMSKHQVPGKQVFSGGSISKHNQRKNKPFSANQNANKIRGVINETPNGMQAANSTHYTSSQNKPGSAATQNNFISKYSKQINGTILSSNDSAEQYEMTSKSINAAERYGVGTTNMVGKESDPQIDTMVAKGQEAGKAQREIEQNEMLLQQTNALQHILNNNSDQNLHERRPVTVGNNNMQYRKLQIGQVDESDNQIYGDKAPSTAVSQAMYQQKQQFSTIEGHSRAINSTNVGQANQRKQIFLPAQVNNAKRSSVSNSGANRRGAVRGELLTNGYKSLRSQGMLLAANSKSNQAAGRTQPLHSRVIPQKGGYFSQENQTFNIQVSDQQFQQQSAPYSPNKIQQNKTKLVPRGLEPTKDKQFEKIITASNSREIKVYIGEAKNSKDSQESLDVIASSALNCNSSDRAHESAIQLEQQQYEGNDKIVVQDDRMQQE